MSRNSIKERNKAIRRAWEKEQLLVQEGKGTRDWTKEQQRDILDPNKGKAYDDQGRAFEGQHMKSASEYPEYQGDPDNIQFLTRDEHLEAHKGSWQNPTNWYYDPVTKEFSEFGDGGIVPCKIIILSDSIVEVEPSRKKEKTVVEGMKSKDQSDEHTASSVKSQKASPSKKTTESINVKSTVSIGTSNSSKALKSENGFIKGLKTAGEFIVDHPECIEIAGVVIAGIAGGIGIASNIIGSRKGGGASIPTPKSGTMSLPKANIASKATDIAEKATRVGGEVIAHKQRYHTKDGVIWKDIASYHRGGKNS